MRALSLCLLALASPCAAQAPLPGTDPLEITGDPAIAMVEGIKQWLRSDAPRLVPRRPPTVERLRYILGVGDARASFADLELVATLRGAPSRRAVRWPVLDGVTAEGLLFEPRAKPVGQVVLLPDAVPDGPERAAAYAERLARAGYLVLSPVLIDREDTWSGNPALRMTNQPHREFLYRMGFPVGRHIIGYEVQKVLAAVDWFARAGGGAPIGVSGYGEGGLIAFYAGALDARIAVTEVVGYFGPRSNLADEPIYRNVWGLLRDFGDAEVARLFNGRRLVVAAGGPRVGGPPAEREGRRGAAPGRIEPVAPAAVEAEARRARELGAAVEVLATASAFVGERLAPTTATPAAVDSAGRMRRQFIELVRFTERVVRQSRYQRDSYWSSTDRQSAAGWRAASAPYRERLWDDVLGRLPEPTLPPHPRTRLAYRDAKWNGYEVTLDLFPGVPAYGVLLIPLGVQPGERLPVVVAQHGLNGRPQDLFGRPTEDRAGTPYFVYRNIGSRLAEAGFAVYLPQNPYINDFRPIVRLGNPWGLTLFSFILAQNERLLDWLGTLDFVDPARIGFYGLSYGGKTALRIPALLDRYALSICSGDFNEWIFKLTNLDEANSYMFSGEYELGEWNLGHVANHAEMAWMIAPRPFMVERGHRDGVGNDEWVALEYARVQRFFDQMGIGERSRIEYFDGPHQIHAVGTVDFLTRWLEPARRSTAASAAR